jgi:hypothetical protein
VLPTGRIFGRLPQKRPNKKKCGRKNLAPNFGRHCAERAKKGPNFWKVCFSTLLPLNFTFPTDTNKDNFVSNGKKRLQKGEIAMGPICFLSGRIFPPDWLKSLQGVGNNVGAYSSQ